MALFQCNDWRDESREMYEPKDNGTSGIMSRITGLIAKNPGMAMAGANLVSNMRGSDVAKFAVAAFAAYKLYNSYQNKKALRENVPGFNYEAKPGQQAGKSGKTLFDKAKDTAGKVREGYGNAKDNLFDLTMDARMENLKGRMDSFQERRSGRPSASDMDKSINTVAPMEQTPAMKKMAEAMASDKHGEGAREYRAYMSNVMDNAEHKLAWNDHLDKHGISDLSELKFCAVDDKGQPLRDADGKALVVNPYAGIQNMPHGDGADMAQQYTYLAAKADIDKSLLYAMDHGQLCGLQKDEAGGYSQIKAPKDAYNLNLAKMDQENLKFAGVKAAIRAEQLDAYRSADMNVKMASVPGYVQAAGQGQAFLDTAEAAEQFRAAAWKARADSAAKGVDFERAQVAGILKTAAPSDIVIGKAQEQVKQGQRQTGAKEQSAAKEPEAGTERKQERDTGKRGAEQPAASGRAAKAHPGTGKILQEPEDVPDFAPPDFQPDLAGGTKPVPGPDAGKREPSLTLDPDLKTAQDKVQARSDYNRAYIDWKNGLGPEPEAAPKEPVPVSREIPESVRKAMDAAQDLQDKLAAKAPAYGPDFE